MNFYEQIFSRGRATGEGMTHFERLFAAKFGGSPPPEVREYTGAVPVTITADGTPLIDYLITGNTTQSGTPTPDNPVMPQGCGERTGNLWNGTLVSGTISNQGVEGDSPGRVRTSIFTELESGTYTLNASSLSGIDVFVFVYNTSGTFLERIPITWTSLPYTFFLLNRSKIKFVFAYTPATSMIAIQPSDISNIMLNLGSAALPYEPYGIKIPISSADTTTPVYLGEVETTRKIKKYEFTGEENISDIGEYYNTNVSVLSIAWSTTISTTGGFQINNDGNRIWALKSYFSSYATATDFKTYLAQQYAAGTPVTVWYVLATETTGIVNEPLMRIGDYADTLSKAQAGVTIPTNNGSTTVDVDTTVKPSEIYIKYMG